MKIKKILALMLSVTLMLSVLAFSPVAPTVAAQKSTVLLSPSDDTFIAQSDSLLDAVSGGETTLEIGYNSANPLPVETGYSGSRYSLLYSRDILIKFDASAIDTNTVSSATLRFYISSVKGGLNSSNSPAVSLAAFETDENWSEGDASWNNAPEAESLAAVSASISKDNCSVGEAVEIDLTSYIRQNPKDVYSFRIKVTSSGLVFHSKESGTAAMRPVLEIDTDPQLTSSVFSSSSLLEDTYAENSDANMDTSLADAQIMTVASDEGTGAALYTRNGFVKINIPVSDGDEDYYYDSVKIILRTKSIANADQTVSLIPVSSDWEGEELTWNSAPQIDTQSEAASCVVVPNDSSAVLNYFTFDITDYVNSNPSSDGIYSFALTADTAVSQFYTSENEISCYRPVTECIYRETARLTLHYTDNGLNDIAAASTITLPVGQSYEPSDYPMAIGDGYYFSSEATEAQNSLPYTVEEGENHVYLIYENKTISGYEEISVTTIQYQAPELPDTMRVMFEGGSDEYFPVSWAQIDPEAYSEGGEFTVMGTLLGIQAEGVSARVTVLGITGVTVPTLSTAPGSYPALPETLTVTLDDGSTRELEVEWDEVDESSYASVGSFIASGRIVLSSMPVQMTVLVEEGTIDDRIAVADTYTMDTEPNTPHNEETLRLSGISSSNSSASALANRKVFLRFKGSDFGEVYHDPDRNADIDPIVSSKVRLYFQSIANSATVTYKIYGINPDYDDWDETSLTWNGCEGISAEYISSISITQSSFSADWVEFDVTSFVRSNRDAEYLSFYIEADLCAAVISSTQTEGQEPTLRTMGYIPDAPVTLRSMAEINGEWVDIAEPLSLTGKLGNSFEYQSAIPNPIYYPDADPDGIYYYDFVTSPTPPADGETDPDLYLDCLDESGNEIVVKYVRRDIVSIDTVETQTYQGVKPTLPETVTVYLDNGAERTENVVWDWDSIYFTHYSTVGSFTMTGTVEHTDIKATAENTVYKAYYSDPVYQSMNTFDLEADTTYRLSFDLTNTDNLSDILDELFTYSGGRYYYAYDNMPTEQYRQYLASFGEGETVDVFFTSPDSESAITLYLPDCVYYMTNARLCQVLGRGGDITVHYLLDGEEIYSRSADVAYGEAYSLPEDFFTIMNGAYTVTGVDSDRSVISSLTQSVVANSDGMNIYLICKASTSFSINTSVENAADVMGKSYTRSTVTAFNGTSTDKSATVIVAKFDTDGKLIGVESNKIEIPTGSSEAVSETKITEVDSDTFTTLLIWDDFEGLNPFETKVDSRNPSGESSKPETGDYILVPAMERYITASTQQSGNEAVNILTRDLTTRWSAQVTDESEPVYADIDLGGIYDVHTVGLGFYYGKSRYTRFSVDVSDNGEDWYTVIAPRYSSGKTSSIEYYTFAAESARYIRIKGYGWKSNEITDEGLVETTGEWFSVTAFEAYGAFNEYYNEVNITEANDFEGLGGITLSSDISESIGNWGADALSEMDYTDYTPATGSSLYADITSTPAVDGFDEGNTALRLYDNTDRSGDETEGAGSIGAFHKLELDSDSYRIRFKWYVPNTIEGSTYNAQWSGLALSAGRVKGGADTSNPVALQLRLSPSGTNKMSFNIIRSITYNDGDQSTLLGSSSSFSANCVWDVILDVDNASDSVVVTVSDGSRTESAFVRYNLYNSERTQSQTWANSGVNYIMFNTGAGGKCEMYIDDFTVSSTVSDEEESGSVVFEQNYNDVPSGTQIRDLVVADTSSALIQESSQEYTPSYGTLLDVSVDPQSMTGGRALHLSDFVDRTEDSSKGCGGVFAYVDIPELSTQNVTKITFDMYAPTYGEYSGFALAHGHNQGGDDQEHPLALQARFSPQSSGMQFNSYPSIQYNKGSASALVGTGSNRLSYGAVWEFELSVNPILGSVTVKVTDGSITSTKTISIPTSGQNSWTTSWDDNPIDTIIFNTGAGSSADIYIDNIVVTDTGISKNSNSAINGLVRYENEYGNGSYTQGAFLTHSATSGSTPTISVAANPYYNRFVERKGLADPDSVSIEVIGMPNYYLVPATSGDGSAVTIQKYKDTDEFRQRATYNKVSSLSNAGSTAFSYQWYVNNDLYLRNNGNVLKLSASGSSGVNKSCTFHVRNEASNYVSDSFSGSSLSSQWYKGYPWYANYHNHSAVHRDANVVVSGGKVLLMATKRGDNEWITNSSGATGYSDSINNNTWKRYVAWTGVISVNSKVYNKGSYIEGSFKQPNSPRGYWTAFWLNGRDSWPPETDMFEYLSSKGTSTWYTATHGGTEGAGWQTSSAVSNLRTTYHTFAIDWGYDYMRMYVNGSLYFTAPDTSYQKNMYLILNTGIGAWESEPDSTTVWDTGLECKWIRSYQYY